MTFELFVPPLPLVVLEQMDIRLQSSNSFGRKGRTRQNTRMLPVENKNIHANDCISYYKPINKVARDKLEWYIQINVKANL